VDGPLLWAVATAFASFIPLFGTALVWGPLALVLGVTHGPLRGLLLAGYGIIVVGLSDNVARPLLMERQLGVHPLFVFLAVFGGLASFGFAGLFLGPLIMALTVAALDLYEQDPAPPAASAP
jgi:predicted PurR-regulated permease PerM